MKRNRLMIAVLITSLMLSGCTASEKNKDKKADEKVSHKEQDKSESKKKEVEKKAKEVKETKKETSQEQGTQASQVEETPVVTDISSLYTDEELLAYANNHLADFWHVYYCFMAGTFFEGTGDFGNTLITDPNIHSLPDIENVWYQYFSWKYPIPYMDINTNIYKEVPFWEENGQVYERYRIDGIPHVSFFFDHIMQKTDDEVWFAYYCKGPDGSISDTQQQWSFVYEDGKLKYGTIVRNY